IGLPVYNGERFLAEAVESILEQKFGDFALVISDNASTDGTEGIGRELAGRDPRVTYLRQAENRGAAWNFNYLALTAESPFFKWAAHDDLLLPAALDRCMDELRRRPEAVLSFTRRVKIDEHGEIVKHNRDRPLRFTASDAPPHERFADWLRLRRGCIEVFGVARRVTMLETRLLGSYAASDRVYLAEMALRGPFAEVPEVLFLHREHRGRSVRDTRAEGRLLQWFDTTKTGSVSFPTWRLGYEYARAVHRAPVPREDRWRSYRALTRWTRRRWRMLGDNIVDVGRRLVSRSH
ncbi:MAG: glycosyltransferase family 2 protein, partial [Acidimicrobiales bacterium]